MDQYFVVVKGPVTGIFASYDEFSKVGTVYKKFFKRQKAEALAWYERSLTLPKIDKNISSLTIHTSGRHYDVSQDKDWYAAVAVVFKNDDLNQSFCLSANRNCEQSHELDFVAFIKALEIARTDIPLRMYTDSKRIAFGINYGLKEWPKHDFNANTKPVLWTRIESLMAYRADLGQVISVEYEQKANIAYFQATQLCTNQCHDRSLDPIKRITRNQCIMWILCAKKLGILRDIRIFIAKLVWTTTAYNTNINIQY